MGAAEPQHAQEANGVDDIVRRSAKRLAACLSCDICCGLLVEPLTSPQCMHCFCRECITGFIMHGQSTSCPVCTAEGVDTALGPDPLRDQLRVDFMITDLLRKVLGKLEWCCCLTQISGQLAPMSTSREVRVLQWQALNREIRQRTGTVKLAEPAAKPLRVLPADGAGCVELFIGMPEDHEMEQPYIRCHASVSVAVLARYLQERILSVAPGDLTVQLRCRQELLQGGMTLGLVQQQLWRPHATSGQLLHIDVEWHAAADAPS